MSKPLSELKVGDTAYIRSGYVAYEYTPVVVVRTTKTRIIVKGGNVPSDQVFGMHGYLLPKDARSITHLVTEIKPRKGSKHEHQ